MTLMTEIRKNVTEATPLMAMVGAADLAVERVRSAAEDAGHLQEELEKRVHVLEKVPADVQARVRKLDAKSVQQVPALAVARALETAGRIEQTYEQLAVRGRELVERVAHQRASEELVRQGKVTLSRTKAAVTTARKAVDETAHVARGAITIGRHDVKEAAAEVAESVAATEKVVQARTRTTRSAAKRTTTTARKQAVSTRTATRSAVTSARKTAAKAVEAVEEAIEKVGDEPTVEAPKPTE